MWVQTGQSFFFLRKERVVLNHRGTVQPNPFTEKTIKKLEITTATPSFRVFTSSSSIQDVRRSQGYSRRLHQRRSPQGGDRRGGLTARRRSRVNGLPSTLTIPSISEDRQDCPATTSNSPLSATSGKAPDGQNPTPTDGEDWKLPSHHRDKSKGISQHQLRRLHRCRN